MEYEPEVPRVEIEIEKSTIPQEDIIKKLKEVENWFEKALEECREIYVNTMKNNDRKFDDKFIKKFTIFEEIRVFTEYLDFLVLDVNSDNDSHKWRVHPIWWNVPNRDLIKIRCVLTDNCYYADLIGCIYYMEKNLEVIIRKLNNYIKELQ